jgi:dTMP kinase
LKASRPDSLLRYYGHGLPYLGDVKHNGRLIVLEGPDSSGRSTQVAALTRHLEAEGHAVLNTGLKRSELISQGIIEAKRNLGIGKRTLSLFYAADFADQLENKIIPALAAGYIVLADRYIYTLMARDAVRGMSRKWCHEVFGFAVVPDMVFFLDVPPEELVHRVFKDRSSLDYYESGMDMGLSEEMYESFILYQRMIASEFRRMQRSYGLVRVDAQRGIADVTADLQGRIDAFLGAVPG